MSELKATTAQEIVRNEKDCDYMDELFGGVKMPPTQVYLKSEADREIRHQKYKRCLAMAKWCENAILGWMGFKASYSSHQRYVKVMLFIKWRNRWIKIAEQFKEAK